MPVVVPDVGQAPEFIDRTGAFGAQGDRMMAFVVVPLKTDKAVVGVLAAQREVQGGARLSDDQRILTMVATLLARCPGLHLLATSRRVLGLDATLWLPPAADKPERPSG